MLTVLGSLSDSGSSDLSLVSILFMLLDFLKFVEVTFFGSHVLEAKTAIDTTYQVYAFVFTFQSHELDKLRFV